MANTLKIKNSTGLNAPPDSTLLEGELAYSEGLDTLYIGSPSIVTDSNTVFLMQSTDGDSGQTITPYTNPTGSGITPTFSSVDVSHSTSHSKFGTSSLAFTSIGKYVDVTLDSALEDFTFEFWFKQVGGGYGHNGSMHFISYDITSANSGYWVYMDTGIHENKFQINDVTAYYNTDAIDLNDGNWHHIALVNPNLTSSIVYVDGTSVNGANNVGLSLTSFRIGTGDAPSWSNQAANAHFEEIRLSTGSVYTEDFVDDLPDAPFSTTGINTSYASTAGDPYWDNVEFLLNGTNNVGQDRITSGGGTIVSGETDPFGGSNAYNFNGSSWWNTDLTLSSDNWTIEGWFKPTTASAYQDIISPYNYPDPDNLRANVVAFHSSKWHVAYVDGSQWQTLSSDNTSPINQWTFIRVVKDGNLIKLYVDDTLIGDKDVTGVHVGGNWPIVIGSQRSSGQNYFTGDIYDLRITNGVARTETTKPTEAFETTAHTGTTGMFSTEVKPDFITYATASASDKVSLDDGSGNTYSFDSPSLSSNASYSFPTAKPASARSLTSDTSGQLGYHLSSTAALEDIANVESDPQNNEILVYNNSNSWEGKSPSALVGDLGLTSASNQTYNNLTLTGNLDVKGNSLQLNTSQLQIADKSLGVGVSGSVYTTPVTATNGIINFLQPSDLYSSGALVTTPVTPATYTDGSEYTIYSFTDDTQTQNFSVNSDITADVLIIAGGGGGGSSYHGGGGGAGGFIYYKDVTISSGTHDVIVGSGGAGGVDSAKGSFGTDGENSSFGSLEVAIGGGGGASTSTGSLNAPTGSSGGSGGGSTSVTGSGGSGTTNQGFAGGNTTNSWNGWSGGGGGGGALGVGETGTGDGYQSGMDGGDGGSGAVEGTSTVYDWTKNDGSTTDFKINGTGDGYAGGGGGATYVAGGGIATHGGGSGSYGVGSSATSNTGGGGGGSGREPGTTTNAGGAGGSGIVILRVLTEDLSSRPKSGDKLFVGDGNDNIPTGYHTLAETMADPHWDNVDVLWNFPEADSSIAGNKDVKDNSTMSVDLATPTVEAPTDTTFGENALKFDLGDAASINNLNFTGVGTFEGMVFADSQTDGYIWDGRAGGTNDGSLYLTGGQNDNMIYMGWTEDGQEWTDHTSYSNTTTPYFTTDEWHHWAIVRDSDNSMRLYWNGRYIVGWTSSIALTNVRLGARFSGEHNFHGWMDEIRMTNGVARYTGTNTDEWSNFLDDGTTAWTQPTEAFLTTSVGSTTITIPNSTYSTASGDTNIDDVTLLIQSRDSDTHSSSASGSIDYSPNTINIGSTSGSIIHTNAVGNPFGDSTATSIFIPAAEALTIPANDSIWRNWDTTFTVEFWFYFASVQEYTYMVSFGGSTQTDAFEIATSGTSIYLEGDGYAGGGGTWNVSEWNHLAIVQTTTDRYIYLNGDRVSTSSILYDVDRHSGYTYQIGKCTYAIRPWYEQDFYLYDLRITNGVARYSGETYDVPTKLFETSYDNTPFDLTLTTESTDAQVDGAGLVFPGDTEKSLIWNEKVIVSGGALATGLVSYYKMDNDYTDSKGSSDGSGGTFDSVNKKIGTHSALFNNTKSNWSVANLPTGNSARSFSLWAKRIGDSSGGVTENVYYYGNDSTSQAFAFGYERASSSYSAGFYGTDLDFGVVDDGNWHHWVLTYDGSGTFKAYQDATVVHTETGMSLNTATGNDLYLGGGEGSNWGGRLFNGSIDELGIWNRDLTAEEVSLLYGTGNGLYFDNTEKDFVSNEADFNFKLTGGDLKVSGNEVSLGGNTIINNSTSQLNTEVDASQIVGQVDGGTYN